MVGTTLNLTGNLFIPVPVPVPVPISTTMNGQICQYPFLMYFLLNIIPLTFHPGFGFGFGLPSSGSGSGSARLFAFGFGFEFGSVSGSGFELHFSPKRTLMLIELLSPIDWLIGGWIIMRKKFPLFIWSSFILFRNQCHQGNAECGTYGIVYFWTLNAIKALYVHTSSPLSIWDLISFFSFPFFSSSCSFPGGYSTFRKRTKRIDQFDPQYLNVESYILLSSIDRTLKKQEKDICRDG